MKHRLSNICLLLGAALLSASAADEYNSGDFGGSSYVQHGPGPAYGGAYAHYGGRLTGLTGRFNASYGEYAGAVPGYGRFNSGSAYGTGALRAAGTGRTVSGKLNSMGMYRRPPVSKGKAPSHAAPPRRPHANEDWP
jgi:hypothetical protein